MRATLTLGLIVLLSACASSRPEAPAAAPPPPPSRSDAPEGPTRTDFQTIAKKLVQRCVAGGWIHKWRAEQPNVDAAAKPKIYLEGFEDRTDKGLDPSYLHSQLESRMRKSGVYEMVTGEGEHDFIGRGRLLRLAERSGRTRISVYTAVLDLVDPKSGKVAYNCEATVEGEL
jgi:hypothetical protein